MMRFWSDKRPVKERWSEAVLEETRTFDLMQFWLDRVRLVDRMQQATLLMDPGYVFRRPFVDVAYLQQEDALLWGVIARRYTGVLFQMLNRKNVEEMSEAPSIINNVFRSARATCQSNTEHRLIPVCIWRTFSGPFGAVVELKAKFMLRAFIDEIGSSDARGVIKVFAYGESTASPASTRELRAYLSRAYRLLHQHLLAWGTRVDSITDNAVQNRTLKELRYEDDQDAYYEQLLVRA